MPEQIATAATTREDELMLTPRFGNCNVISKQMILPAIVIAIIKNDRVTKIWFL